MASMREPDLRLAGMSSVNFVQNTALKHHQAFLYTDCLVFVPLGLIVGHKYAPQHDAASISKHQRQDVQFLAGMEH